MTRDQVLSRLGAWADSTRAPYVPHSARWGDTADGVHRFLGDRPLRQYDSHRERLEGFARERAEDLLDLFEAEAYLPRTPFPTFNRYRGEVAAGFVLRVGAAQGDLFITTDGRDPRDPSSGSPSSTAQRLSSPAELTVEQTTHVKARALRDGEWSAQSEGVLRVGHEPSALRISEIMYHPRALLDSSEGAPSEDFEWLELFNSGLGALQLRGLYFCDGITFRFSEHWVLPAGGRLVLARPGPAFETRYPGVVPAGTFAGSLSNGGERIAICDPSGEVLLALDYDDTAPWPAEADGQGHSLVLDEEGNPGDPGSWRLSRMLDGAPGDAD